MRYLEEAILNNREDTRERGWCPVIFCLLHNDANQSAFVETVLVVFEPEIQEDGSPSNGASSTGRSVCTLTGQFNECQTINDILENMEREGLGQYISDAETQSILQEGLTQLEPYLITDRVLSEGWCELRVDLQSDYNMFAFLDYHGISIDLYSSGQKLLGAFIDLGDAVYGWA